MFEEDVVRPKIFMVNLLTSYSFKSLSFFLILFPPQYRGRMFVSNCALKHGLKTEFRRQINLQCR
jgi:hypothetical protein